MSSKKYKNLFPFHLTKPASCGIISSVSERTSRMNAEVAELADAHVWGACGSHHTGSSPVSRTIMHQQKRYLVRKARKSPVLRGFFAFLGNFGLCQQKSQTVDISTLFFGSDGTWTQTVKFFWGRSPIFIINRRMRNFFASLWRGEWKVLIRPFCFSNWKIRKGKFEKTEETIPSAYVCYYLFYLRFILCSIY